MNGQDQTEREPATEKKKTCGETLSQEAVKYLENHYSEKFSLQKMADELFVNGSYLLRVFKKHTGFTPLSYHNRVRCERAKEMLICGSEGISDIGEAVGFVSPAHFSRIFKKLEGCTPTEYRDRRSRDSGAEKNL